MRVLAAIAMAILALAGASVEEARAQGTVAERYRALVAEFEEFGGAAEYAPKFLQLAEQHPADPAAMDALAWLLKNRRTRPEGARAIELLEAHHAGAESLTAVLPLVARTSAVASERLLRAVMERSSHPHVKAHACYYLASLLEEQRSVVAQLRDDPELGRRALQYYGQDYGRHLAALDAETIDRALVTNYEEMGRRFAEALVGDLVLGDVAAKALFRIRHLSVGRVAPEIKGQDILGGEFKLSDYRGKVVMLSFWGHW